MISLPWTQMSPQVAGLYLHAAEVGHVFVFHVEPRFDNKLIARGPLEPVAHHLEPVDKFGGLWFGPITDPMLALGSNTATQTTPNKLNE